LGLPRPKELRGADMCCIDPYVKVSVYNVIMTERECRQIFQTGVVNNNGFFPIWNEEKFKFTVEHWAIAMLQLTVLDKCLDESIATSLIPVAR
jgi:uncharacterized membrane protein